MVIVFVLWCAAGAILLLGLSIYAEWEELHSHFQMSGALRPKTGLK